MIAINVSAAVDQLGFVRRDLKALECAERELREFILSAEIDRCAGKRYSATVSRFSAEQTDWRTIAESLNPSPQLVRAHTKSVDRAVIRTTVLDRSADA